MERFGPYGAEQLFFSIYPDLAAGQNAGVHAAHIAHAQAAVLLDVHHHQADFIDMGGQHHLGPGSPFMGDHVVHAVDKNLVAIRFELLFHVFRHGLFVAGQAGQRRYFGKEGLDVHRIPPSFIAPAGRGWT